MVRNVLLTGVVLVLVSGAFAGCLNSDEPTGKNVRGSVKVQASPPKVWSATDPILSQPVFSDVLFEHLPLRASDGTQLDNWLFRPKTPDDVKVPAIVHLSPYFGSSLPRGGGGMEKMMRENFTARGYAVVAASVRGTGFSEGCFEIGGPRERQDAKELFATIANQSWSNGNVAAIGVSYDGTAPQGALIAGSPHLRTIVPIAAISEWYKYNFIKGVQINPQGYAFNTYYVALESIAPNTHGEAAQLADDLRIHGTRLCERSGGSPNSRGPTFVDVQRAQLLTGPTGMTDPYWEERNFTKYLERVQPNVSALIVHGLIDYNVKTHNLLPWATELQKHGVETKFLLGQWGHAYPGTTRPNGRVDWNVTLLRWFDYWLKGIDTGIMDEPRADIQDFAGVWRQEDNFPPSRVEPKRFYFDAGGKLKTEPGAGQLSFVDNGVAYNPQAPANLGAVVQLSDRLEQEFRYSGEAVATLELTHGAPRGQIGVTVFNVTGAIWRPINWGYYNYNIRNGPAQYDAVLPNQRFKLEIPLLPTDMVIGKGSQLAVVLSGQTAGGPGMLPPPSGGTTTIMNGANSYITFPYLDSVAPMEPQPRMTGR